MLTCLSANALSVLVLLAHTLPKANFYIEIERKLLTRKDCRISPSTSRRRFHNPSGKSQTAIQNRSGSAGQAVHQRKALVEPSPWPWCCETPKRMTAVPLIPARSQTHELPRSIRPPTHSAVRWPSRSPRLKAAAAAASAWLRASSKQRPCFRSPTITAQVNNQVHRADLCTTTS